jgi:hypothetical protein
LSVVLSAAKTVGWSVEQKAAMTAAHLDKNLAARMAAQ